MLPFEHFIPPYQGGRNPSVRGPAGISRFFRSIIPALVAWTILCLLPSPSSAKSRSVAALRMPDGSPLIFDELCDLLAQDNFKAIAAVDSMMETRDLAYRDPALDALGEIDLVLQEILRTPNLPKRIPETVRLLAEKQEANREMVRRMGDRLSSFAAGRRAIFAMVETMDDLVIDQVEPLLSPARNYDSDLFDAVGALRQITVAAFQMPWGVSRQAEFNDSYPMQKAQKTFMDASVLLNRAVSELDAWYFAGEFHLLSLEANRRLVGYLAQLRHMAEELSDQTKITYDSKVALNRLYADFTANVSMLDQLIISELLVSCFF